MPESITILGDGAMGIVCSILLCAAGHSVRIWGAPPDSIAHLAKHRSNEKLLPGIRLPDSVQVTPDDRAALLDCSMIVSALPAQFVRSTWSRLVSHAPPKIPIISVTKGIEIESTLRPTQVIAAVAPATADRLAVLSGPNIAAELARKLPATAVVAGLPDLAARAQRAFSTPWLRLYTSTDIIGVELAGATKNIIAIAAGILDGLQAGNNAKAALVTRGLVEITRLGLALGAEPQTFPGLAGLGDLVTTCISPEGRNRSLGQLLGQGLPLKTALAQIPSIVEGVPTTQAVHTLAHNHQIEMPITTAVHSVLFQNKPARQALADLMARQMKSEA